MTISNSPAKPFSDKYFQDNLRGIKICRTATVPYILTGHFLIQHEYMRNIGMNVVLISSDGQELSKIKTGLGLSHEVVEIPRSLSPLKDIIALIKLIKIFRKYKFDIVHSITPKAGLLSAIASFIARVPVRLHTWTGQRWVTLKGPMRWFSRFADRVIGILNTRCYADSQSQRWFLINERIIAPEKISVIGYGSLAGVDLNRFDPEQWTVSAKRQLKQELSIKPDSKVLIFIGRVTRDKGIFELLSAFRELLILGYDADLLIVGPFDQNCGGIGTINMDDLKQSPRIHYIEYAESPERYLGISDILCLPSYREGFSTVVIQAAAMGIPTIGTDISGIVDPVVDGVTGILVPPYDDKSLLRALKQLLDDTNLAYRMGKAARQRCVQQFNADIVNKKMAEEYMRLLRRC